MMVPLKNSDKSEAGKNAGEKIMVPCARCSGRGMIEVDSGTTLAGGREVELGIQNKISACPDCHGRGSIIKSESETESLFGISKDSRGIYQFTHASCVTTHEPPLTTIEKRRKRWWRFWK